MQRIIRKTRLMRWGTGLLWVCLDAVGGHSRVLIHVALDHFSI